MALLLAWEAIPAPWPVLDLIERLEMLRSSPVHAEGPRHDHLSRPHP